MAEAFDRTAAGRLGGTLLVGQHRFAPARERGEQRLVFEAAELLAAQQVGGVDDRAVLVDGLIDVEHHVARQTSVREAIAAHVQNARKGELGRLLGHLEACRPRIVGRGARRRKLVHAAQGRLVVGRGELGAHAPRHDLGTLVANGLDGVFVQIVRQHDAAVGQTRLVEPLAGVARKPRQIARIDADARKALPPLAHLEADRDGVVDAALDIVGVHEKHAVGREALRVGAKSLELVVERHDP